MSDKKCLTPGAEWQFDIHPGSIAIKVSFESLRLYSKDGAKKTKEIGIFDFTEQEAQEIENELHDAVEKVLARLWSEQNREYAALKQNEVS